MFQPFNSPVLSELRGLRNIQWKGKQKGKRKGNGEARMIRISVRLKLLVGRQGLSVGLETHAASRSVSPSCRTFSSRACADETFVPYALRYPSRLLVPRATYTDPEAFALSPEQ